MFGPEFVHNVLAPAAEGQPGFIHALVQGGMLLWNTNMPLWNALVAFLQIAIGLVLFLPVGNKVWKLGVITSIVWGSIIWMFGEGVGQLFTGTASLYTGAPGAAAIYIVLSVLLIYRDRISVHVYPKILGGIFVGGAFLQIQPTLWSMEGMMSNFMMSTQSHFVVINAIPIYVSSLAMLAPAMYNIPLILAPLIIGLGLLFQPTKWIGALAGVFLLFVWWFGQDFGGLFTLMVNTATDPSTAPLLAVMLIPLFVQKESSTVYDAVSLVTQS